MRVSMSRLKPYTNETNAARSTDAASINTHVMGGNIRLLKVHTQEAHACKEVTHRKRMMCLLCMHRLSTRRQYTKEPLMLKELHNRPDALLCTTPIDEILCVTHHTRK